MPTLAIVAFAFSSIGVAWAFAFAIVHICRLVEKVSKLNASNSILDYRALQAEAERKKQPEAMQTPLREGPSDGTLETEDAAFAIAKII